MDESTSGDVRIRHVLAGEHERLRRLRLASLQADPNAFGGTYADEAARPSSWWERWAERSSDGSAQRTFVLVAGEDDWIALALVRLDEDRPGLAVLNAMWVEPRARRRGAAIRLCDACAEWAAQHGCGGLTLDVVVDNDAARLAYESAGFTVRGHTTWSAHGRTLEELVMERALP
jgi:GNAT superfamily N-acetyltransferase